jgi:hypothetical protein
LFPAITVASFLQACWRVHTLRARRLEGSRCRILYGGFIFFTAAVYGALYAITGDSSLSWLSVGQSQTQVIDVIFRLTPRYATPWQVSLIVVLGLIVLSFSVLERRVRGVEVVT